MELIVKGDEPYNPDAVCFACGNDGVASKYVKNQSVWHGMLRTCKRCEYEWWEKPLFAETSNEEDVLREQIDE